MAAKPPNKEDKAASDDLAAELRPIEADIDALERSAGSLAALRDEMLSSGRRKAKEAYEAQLGEVEATAARATGRIRSLEARTRGGSERGLYNKAEIKQRLQLSSRLTQRLLDVTQRHWTDKNDFEQRVQGQVARRVRVRYTDANGVHKSEAECQQMAQQMLRAKKQAFLFMQARSILAEAVEEHEQLQALNADVLELMGLIKHMKQLIRWQQEQLAVVEKTANKAGDHLDAGVANLTQVRKGELIRGVRSSRSKSGGR